MSKPDYAKWMRKDYWTLIQAAFLLSDQEPLANQQEAMRCVQAGKPVALIDIYDDLKNADIKKTLKVIDPGHPGWVGHRRVEPLHCVEWALKKRGIVVPEPLRQFAAAAAANNQESSERAEEAHLKVIGALLKVLLGKQQNGKPYSVCRSQANVIQAIQGMCPNERGFGTRKLEDVFARANETLTPK